MASIAVLPVLIGLAVDYAIQFQARYDEATRAADGETARRARGAPRRAGGPTIATAGLATAVGFLVLLLSPVPMVRGFGALLVLGIVLALACALYRRLRRAGALRRAAAHGRAARPPARARSGLRALRPIARACDRVSRELAGAIGLLARARRSRSTGPRRVLAVGLAVAVVGWRSTPRARSSPTCASWCPQDLPGAQGRRTSSRRRPASRARST